MNALFILIAVIGAALAPRLVSAADPPPAAPAACLAAQPYITIYGQVNRQGRYEFKPQMNADDALKLAGGATGSANLKKVKLIRKDDTGKNTTTIFNFVKADNFPLLKAGDVIIVDEKLEDL